jgi:hypothetical protein
MQIFGTEGYAARRINQGEHLKGEILLPIGIAHLVHWYQASKIALLLEVAREDCVMKQAATPQLHIRVSPDLKKAVKMFCVRDGTTAQAWINMLIENELRHKAPDLWTPGNKEGDEAQK